jgi:hypothetical protein
LQKIAEERLPCRINLRRPIECHSLSQQLLDRVRSSISPALVARA